MGAFQTFDFETNPVRAMTVDDEPWFVAADVCRILGISNHRDAIEKLDADEKDGVGLTDAIGREQQTSIINESGLYTLILRSRDATTAGTPAHRFRKHVTSVILPAIRKTGAYVGEGEDDDIFPTSAHGRIWGCPVSKINAAARMIGVAHRIYGPEAARALWERETSLPSLNKLSVISITGTPSDDPIGCWKHLMRAQAGNGMTIGALLDLAIRDKVAARKLREYGICVNPIDEGPTIAIANKGKFLASLFADTQWVDAWRLALVQLPNAKPSKRAIGFGSENARAVILPIDDVLKLRNPTH